MKAGGTLARDGASGAEPAACVPSRIPIPHIDWVQPV
jgi:hypothetical protein